jgi:sugar phosphate isomerase/epimerase
MRFHDDFSRRGFLAAAASLPLAAQSSRRVLIGLELYSVRDELKADLFGTVKAVAKMGYECVEFYAPYFDWTPDYAKDVRKLLDDLNVRCPSTHNSSNVFTPERLPKAIELNGILGSRYIVMASAGRVAGLDGWKAVADRLNQASDTLASAGMRAGFHNHQTEFMPIEGTRPMDVLARNTVKTVTLQLDVGTCVHAGADPVAWINQNPGRITSLHLKDWSPEPDKGYTVLFGEGVAPWKQIFRAAETTGGVEHYLIEQEGSRFPALETAGRCLAAMRAMRS